MAFFARRIRPNNPRIRSLSDASNTGTPGESCADPIDLGTVTNGSSFTGTLNGPTWFTFTLSGDVSDVKDSSSGNTIITSYSGSCGSLVEIETGQDEYITVTGATRILVESDLTYPTPYALDFTYFPPFQIRGTGTSNRTTSGNHTITLPTNVAGDLMVVGVYFRNGSQTYPTLTGWTAGNQNFSLDGQSTFKWWYKNSAGSEASVVLSSLGTYSYCCTGAFVASNAYMFSNSVNGNAPGTTITCPSLNASFSPNILINAYCALGVITASGTGVTTDAFAYLYNAFNSTGATPSNTGSTLIFSFPIGASMLITKEN